MAEEKHGEFKVDSSIEFMWNKWLEEFEQVNKQMDQQEKDWLNSFDQWIETMKRNEKSQKDVLLQITNHQKDWMKYVRQEFLTISAGTRYFIPVDSVEETDLKLKELEEKVLRFLNTSFLLDQTKEGRDKAYQALKDYFTYCSENREKVANLLRSSTEEIKRQQMGIVNVWEKQVKNMMFPFTSFINKKAVK
jgi:hypothetical protein